MNLADLKPPISGLPEELIQHIFSFLELKELQNASFVCHAWQNIAHDQGKKTNPGYCEVIPFLATNFDLAIGRKCAEILNPSSRNMFSPINLEDDLMGVELHDLDKLVNLSTHPDCPEELATIVKTKKALDYLVMLGNTNEIFYSKDFVSKNPFEPTCFKSIIHLAEQNKLDHLFNAINDHDSPSFKTMISYEIFTTLIINGYVSEAKQFLTALLHNNPHR